MLFLRRLFIGGLLSGMVLMLAGCQEARRPALTWQDLMRNLADLDGIARIDQPSSVLTSSYDRAGGNEDYNNFVRPSTNAGWVVLADLDGPGYVSRFWFTGVKAEHPLRFYFDGETEPRLAISLGELCGGREPFVSPLAEYKNYCFYSFVPLPYQRGLRIETLEGGNKPGGWPRLFYQINAVKLQRGRKVESLPSAFSAEDLELARQTGQAWLRSPVERVGECANVTTQQITVAAGTVTEICKLDGPAILRLLTIRPDFESIASPTEREILLRNLVLRIFWDDSSSASVAVPLGDFFGSFWERIRYQSAYFGLVDNTFISAFPMPFAKNARLAVENHGRQAVGLEVAAHWDAVEKWDVGWGYFHAGWQRSGPEAVGKPHQVLRVKGRGRFAGCILGVTSLDKSFWILEGDETIRKDQETQPGWRGTGLEDYFNGGWYYQNVMAFPFHGVPAKVPFRTLQYCMHVPHPVLFKDSLDMEFERGPDHASHGWMESVAYYYLAAPTPAYSKLGTPAMRQAPQDPALAPATVMMEIWNRERFGDYRGANEYIDRYLEQYPQFSFAEMLRLRQAAYLEKEAGFTAARADYEKIRDSATQELTRQMADNLLWFHQSVSNALLILYANTGAKVYLDGQEIGQSSDAEQAKIWRVNVAPGSHVLALQAPWKQYPDWTQVILRTHSGDILSTVDWKHALNPANGWQTLDYDDSSWQPVRVGVKGPPEEPYIWVVPDPHINAQSRADGLRPDLDWPDHKGSVVYRKTWVE